MRSWKSIISDQDFQPSTLQKRKWGALLQKAKITWHRRVSVHRRSPCWRSPASAAPPQPSPPSRRLGETGAAVCSTSVETWPRVCDKAAYLLCWCFCSNTVRAFKPSTSPTSRSCAHRYPGSSGAVLLGPEFSPPVWRMPVLAFTTRIHLCHESRDQGEVQDPGECEVKWVTGKGVVVLLGVMCLSQQGSVCEDWTTVYCCYPLAVCQMIREMKRRMKTQTYHVTTALECSWRHSRRWKMRLLMAVRWPQAMSCNTWPTGQSFFSTPELFFFLVSVVIWYCIFTYLIK